MNILNVNSKQGLASQATVLKGPAQIEAKPYLEYFGKSNRSDNNSGNNASSVPYNNESKKSSGN